MLASAAVVALAFVAIGTGCSSSGSKSASDQVCSARSDLSKAVDTVANDVRSGNLGTARNNLDQVRSAYNNLVNSFDKLTAEQRQKLQPQIDKIKADAQSLTSANSAEQIGRTLDTIGSDVQSALNTITHDLNCG
jgi:hypothetical protein